MHTVSLRQDFSSFDEDDLTLGRWQRLRACAGALLPKRHQLGSYLGKGFTDMFMCRRFAYALIQSENQ